MALTMCEECGQQLSNRAWACPHCGAPGPGAAAGLLRAGGGYEYRSRATLWGLPLVHVATGPGGRRGLPPRVARGIIAVGDVAVGVVALGGVAVGGLAFGGVSLGVICLGGLAIGALGAVGGAALSLGLAVGGLAIGKFALGGAAFGLHAVGGNHPDPQAWEEFRRHLPWLGSGG